MIRKSIFIFLLAIVSLRAEDTYNYNTYLGFSGSSISGIGFSYLQMFGDFGAKLTCFAFYNDSEENSDYYYNNDDIFASIGLDLQRNLIKSDNTRFYTFLGLGLNYSEQDYYNWSQNDMYLSSDIERHWSVGAGIGIEFIVFKHISLNFEGGYQWRHSVETEYDKLYPTEPRKKNYIGFGGGMGIMYAF